MKANVEVLNGGAFATVQDMGRPGYRKYGVPVSGAMDIASAGLANALVRNSQDEAVLEIALSGPELQFHVPCLLAITGADISPRLNGAVTPLYTPVLAKAGDELRFGRLKSGCRAYVAVHDGFKTEVVMGSRSWHSHITGRARLKKGDLLSVKAFGDNFEAVHASVTTPAFKERELRAWPGPEFMLLPEKMREQLIAREFSVSGQTNRMGYRLAEKVEMTQFLPEILTSAVIPGTVQLTPSGELIILMRDCQTTGGYPRILQLTDEAIDTLAQKKTSESIVFTLPE